MRRVSAVATHSVVKTLLSSLASARAPGASNSVRLPPSLLLPHLPLALAPAPTASLGLARALHSGGTAAATTGHHPVAMLVRSGSSAVAARAAGGTTMAPLPSAAARHSAPPIHPHHHHHHRSASSILARASTTGAGAGASSSSGPGDRGALQPRGATAAPSAAPYSSSSSPSPTQPADPTSPPTTARRPPGSPSGGHPHASSHRHPHRPPRLRVRSGASMLPHPEKAHRGGEDAFFIADGAALHAKARGRTPSPSPSSPSPPPQPSASPHPLSSAATACPDAADAHLRAHDEDDPHDPHHPHHHAAFGVADGVGGWAEVGVDAGAYARMLMDCARDEAEKAMTEAAEATAARRRRQKAREAGGEGAAAAAATTTAATDEDGDDDDDDEPPHLSAQDILERAFYRTDVQGSSTACVCVLNGATLAASNLGDSGFAVVRGGQTAFQSPQQQHNFNFPYQLGSAESMSDQPQAAMRFEMEVAPGDTVVVGSDGLWDNVFAEEAAAIVSRCRSSGQPPDEAAATLARYARMRAADAKHHSPFSYAAVAAGYVYVGGKMDDIAVIVAYVEDAHGGGGGGGGAGADERPRSRL